jgi:D-glycerate 3-kinase
VNQPGGRKVQVVILEGWCVGFRALAPELVREKREASRADPASTLWKNRLESLVFVNERLREYDVMTDVLDAFIHVDAEETSYVYAWRLEQEVALRKAKGVENAMTDEQVRSFVDGYYPAYELYTDSLRKGVFHDVPEKKGAQLRLVVGRDRRVKTVEQI